MRWLISAWIAGPSRTLLDYPSGVGVGRGRVFDPHADLHRYALFTVWDSYSALQQFEAHSAIMQRILRRAEEVLHGLLFSSSSL